MTADPSPRRLHLWTALVLVAVFAGGVATGVGASWALRPPPHGRPGRPPAGGGLPPFVGELGLSAEQQARVRAIVEGHRGEMEAAIRDAFPRVRAIQDRVDGEIREVLTPEQAARFDSLRSRRPPLPGPGGPGMPPMPPPGRPPPPEAPPPR